MRQATTKLKRYKVLTTVLIVVLLPIRLPLALLYRTGEIAEKVLELIDGIAIDFLHFIGDKFKFDDVAKKRYGTNRTNKIQ